MNSKYEDLSVERKLLILGYIVDFAFDSDHIKYFDAVELILETTWRKKLIL
jgi:hypothetical protein